MELLPFKPTLLAVLFPPPRDIRIQPVYISYGARTDAIAWHSNEGATSNVGRMLSLPGKTEVVLHFLEPLHPGEHPDRKSIAQQARTRIEQAQHASASTKPSI